MSTIDENMNESFEDKVSSIGTLLTDIRDEYEETLSKIKNSDYTHLLERIVSAEKDLKTLSDKVSEIKSSTDCNNESLNKITIQFQELSGSVNQLKLIVDEFKEYHKVEKENKVNFIFQIIVPIILAIVFFLSGLFFKSCSSIHQQNINQNSKNTNNSYEYKNFESYKNK